MKKIKFIKDFMATKSDDYRDLHAILIKRGDIVDVDGCEYNGSYFDMPKEQAQWLIDNGFAEEVKESGWWKPKLGEEYFTIKMNGKISTTIWVGDSNDEFVYSLGLCFKTKDVAERHRDYLKAVATVRQDEGVLTPEQIHDECQDSCIHYVGVRQNGQLAVDCILVNWDTIIASSIYFDTYKQADASLDNHPDEWKIIANYDWSRE